MWTSHAGSAQRRGTGVGVVRQTNDVATRSEQIHAGAVVRKVGARVLTVGRPNRDSLVT